MPLFFYGCRIYIVNNAEKGGGVSKVKGHNNEIRVLESASTEFIGKFTACFFAVNMMTACSSKNYDNEGAIIEVFKEVNAEQAHEQEIRVNQREIRQPHYYYRKLKIAPPEIG